MLEEIYKGTMQQDEDKVKIKDIRSISSTGEHTTGDISPNIGKKNNLTILNIE